MKAPPDSRRINNRIFRVSCNQIATYSHPIITNGNIMRFLVDLYRRLIFLVLAGAIIGGSWFIFSQDLTAANPQRMTLIFGLISIVAATIVGLGVIAIFISTHDRIAEIARNSARIADVLERDNRHVEGRA